MVVGLGVDELHDHTYAITGSLGRALHDGRNAQLGRYLSAGLLGPAVGHHGCPGHDPESADPGQSAEQLIVHAVGERGVLLASAYCLEGKHRDGGAVVRKGDTRCRRYGVASEQRYQQPTDPQQPADDEQLRA